MLRISDRLLLFGSTFASQGLRIATTLVLARTLSESDYGRFQLVISAAGILHSLGDFGVYRVVTTRQDKPIEVVLEVAALVTVGLYTVYTLFALGLGIYYSRAFGDSRLFWAGALYAFMTAMSGYYGLQVAALARELRFARWAGVEMTLGVLQALLSVILALTGAGLFALAIPPVVSQMAVIAIAPHHRAIRLPRHWPREELCEFLSFGWKNAVYQYANNMWGVLTNLIVGEVNFPPRVVNRESRAEALGVFGRALNIRSLFSYNLVLAVEKVIYPLMCRDQNDPQRYANLFIRGCVYVFGVTGFGMVLYLSAAPDLIRVMLGPRWDEVPRLLQIVSLDLVFVGFNVVAVSTAMIYQRPLLAFAFSLMQLTFIAPATWFYYRFGPAAFGLVLAAGQSLTSTMFVVYIAKQYGVPRRRLLKRLLPLASVLAMVGGTIFFSRIVFLQFSHDAEEFWPTFIRLTISVGAGCIVGVFALAVIDKHTYREFRNLISRKWPDEPVPEVVQEPPPP